MNGNSNEPQDKVKPKGEKNKHWKRISAIVASIIAIIPPMAEFLRRILSYQAGKTTDEIEGAVESIKSTADLPFWGVLGWLILAAFLLWFIWYQGRDLKKTKQAKEDLEIRFNKTEQALKEKQRDEIRVIHPTQYLEILQRVVKHYGDGRLYLFNVELNSFTDKPMLDNFWRKVVEMKEVKEVHLALPPRKFKRWVDIVTQKIPEFFDEENHGTKFKACQYDIDPLDGEDRIAFAIYDSDINPGVHDWAIMFLLNRPFIDQEGNYQHILEYVGNEQMLSGLRASVWSKVYNSTWEESTAMIMMADKIKRQGISLDQVLEAHGVQKESPIAENIRRVVGARRVIHNTAQSMVPLPGQLPQIQPDANGNRSFQLNYHREPDTFGGPQESVEGYVVGLRDDRQAGDQPCIIWNSGFGDGAKPQLAEVLSRRIDAKNRNLVEVFFRKSGAIADTTCTRTEEDMKAVLKYTVDIPGIDRTHICLIGISLCGYLAAKTAEKDSRVQSVIIICPPFDIIEMVDDFHLHYLGREGRQRVPLFEDFLKARSNSRVAEWESERQKFCNYFNNVISAAHLVDFAVKGPENFCRKSFLDALGTITRSGRRVALVYGTADPIVNPTKNIPMVKEEIRRGNIINENLFLHPLPVGGHYFPERIEEEGGHEGGGQYPFEIPDEGAGDLERNKEIMRLVRLLARAIKECIGEMVLDPSLLKADESSGSEGQSALNTG